MNITLTSFTDVLVDEICNSQPLSLSSTESGPTLSDARVIRTERPHKGTGQRGQFRSTEEIEPKYRDVFSYPYFNLVQSSVIEDALYTDKSIVVCAPTGSGKTVVFEMAIVQLLRELDDKHYTEDFKIIYMAPVKALCTERLTEWYSKFTRLGLLCIEVTGDTDVDFTQLKPYKIIITTPEKWDMLTRRWRDHRGLVEVIKLFLIDEVHILNDEIRGPVLEAVVSRMKTIENSAQSVHRIENLQKTIQGQTVSNKSAPRIRFVAVSATVSNPEDVANWLGTSDKPAVFYKFGDECRPVKLRRIVEGYPCYEGTNIFKFDIILNYKLWPIIQKYHAGKPTLIFCNTRKSVILTAETLSRELTISFNAEQKAKLTALASSIKNKKLQALVMSGVGCHHAGLLYEERQNIELAFRNRDLPILITTTTLAMGVNLPAHLVIVKNTQQYVNGAYQEYSISTVLQMVGRAGRPQFDTEATAVIMTRLVDKPRYQSLVDGCEPLQSYLHKRLPENLNGEAALGTVGDVAQCVQWLRSTFLYVRAARDPKKYLGLPQNSPQHLISKKIEELCVKAMNGLASSGLITMDEASCIESTEAGRLMSLFYLDLETMKQIMKIEGTESLERLLVLICESHELADMHLRVDERRCLNTLNRNNAAATIRFPMKGKISTRQMKLNCIIQAVLGCLSIPDPSLNQEAMKIMRIADRVCKCLVAYITRPDLISQQPQFYSAVLNSILLAKCVTAHLWENSPYVSKQLKGIGPTFSALLSSAGKVNFMLLEESHPRDLERIMNKGAPAGNVLRKQVNLLPKYQLTMIPVDEKTVTVQLVLLNQSHLSENMANLTAGDSHKCYIIVGDSNNNLLLLAAFKDKDLISVFDGTISHKVRRKHNFEHKIFAHCISSSFVGIDVQSEYLFNDLEQVLGGPCTKNLKNDFPSKKNAERQTCITDTFKERKRKNTYAIEQSKEKRKRESALIENFKHLKKSFEAASNNVNQSLHQRSKQNNELLNKKADTCSLPSNTISNVPSTPNTNSITDNQLNSLANQKILYNKDIDSDEFIDEEKIDSILNEIENEMCKSKASSDNTKLYLNSNKFFREKNLNIENPFSIKFNAEDALKDMPEKSSSYKTVSTSRKRKPTKPKSNYSFIDLLERNLSLSDDEDKTVVPQKDNGFSDTIKSQIQKYLTKTQTKCSVPDRNIEMLKLLDKPKIELPIDDKNPLEINPINLDCNKTVDSIHNTYPRYEIKEILGGKHGVEQNDVIKDSENLICNPASIDCDMSNTHDIKKHYKFDKVDTIHDETNMKALTPLRNLHTYILDDEGSQNSSNKCHEVEENTIPNETKSLDFDRGSEICTNKENLKCEVSNNYNEKNYLHNIICVEDNNHKKESMTNPKEFSKERSKTTDMNKNTKINNNLNDVLLSKKELCNSQESTRIDALAKNPCFDIIPKNKDPLVKYTRQRDIATHDNTLTIEDIGRNTSYPSVSYTMSHPSDFINDSQNLNNSSKDKGVNKQKPEYVKRYTYSTSKIDVCTKQTPEYCVQVIKKVKMDLDITAIVSRKYNYKSDCDGTSTNNEEIKVIELPKHENTFQNATQGVSKIITAVNNEIRNTSKINLPSAFIFHRPVHTTAENLLPLPNKAIIEEEDNSNNPQIINKSEGHQTLDCLLNKDETNNGTDELPIPEIVHEDLEEQDYHVIYGNNSGKLKQTKSENSPINGENKIENILQKYSKIIANNAVKTVTPSSSGNNTTVTSNRHPTVKSKKPFKITDIHKLHATLPNTIVEYKHEVEKNKQLLKIYNCVEAQNKLKNYNSSQYTQSTEMRPIDEIADYESITDLEPIHLPANVDLEPSKDYKIDQSMFDPKTLLQCVVDEGCDELIPPPPEFCDGITFSPGCDSAEYSMADDRARTPELHIYTEEEMEYNESIFDDPCATDLTPSREIETWNLSQDDSREPHNPMNLSPAKSFTVMCRNTSNDCNFFRNSVKSRNVNLGKFTFSQKNKLKIRK